MDEDFSLALETCILKQIWTSKYKRTLGIKIVYANYFTVPILKKWNFILLLMFYVGDTNFSSPLIGQNNKL